MQGLPADTQMPRHALCRQLTTEQALLDQLQHLQADFAEQSVRDVLSSRTDNKEPASTQLMVTPSPTSNAIIVTATAKQLEAIRQVIAEIDRPRRQVEITAVIAELSDDDFTALGLNVGGKTDRLDLALRAAWALQQAGVAHLNPPAALP